MSFKSLKDGIEYANAQRTGSLVSASFSGTVTFADNTTYASGKGPCFIDANSKLSSDGTTLTLTTDKHLQETLTAGNKTETIAGYKSTVATGDIYQTADEDYKYIADVADGNIGDRAAVMIDGSGATVVAIANATTVKGINTSGVAVSPNPINVATTGIVNGVADSLVEMGQPLKVGDSIGSLGPALTSNTTSTVMQTSAAAGIAYTNQPANDQLTVESSNAGDTSVVITIIGTTHGTDTVVVEDVTLDGADATTPVDSVKADWGLILAVKKAATIGNIVIKEKSGGLTVRTVPLASTTDGVIAVATETRALNAAPVILSDNATTKQIGMKYKTVTANADAYDSQALNGTTAQTMNAAMKTVTELYVGDLEAARTITLQRTATADEPTRIVGTALAAAAARGDALKLQLDLA